MQPSKDKDMTTNDAIMLMQTRFNQLGVARKLFKRGLTILTSASLNRARHNNAHVDCVWPDICFILQLVRSQKHLLNKRNKSCKEI